MERSDQGDWEWGEKVGRRPRVLERTTPRRETGACQAAHCCREEAHLTLLGAAGSAQAEAAWWAGTERAQSGAQWEPAGPLESAGWRPQHAPPSVFLSTDCSNRHLVLPGSGTRQPAPAAPAQVKAGSGSRCPEASKAHHVCPSGLQAFGLDETK